MVTVGVLALQGAFIEHAAILRTLGAQVALVRTPADLDEVEALVLPGGESTAMARLARGTGLFEAVRRRLRSGMPALGTCAGLILLADEVTDAAGLAGLGTIGGLRVTVRRNAFGAQLASGETAVSLTGGGLMHGVFIRAPRIESVGAGVQVLATRPGADGPEPVVVREGGIVGATFHPELAGETLLHEIVIAAAAQHGGGLSPSSSRESDQIRTASAARRTR